MSNGGNIHMTDNIARIPLHYAAAQGHYQCVFTLVGIGSRTNAIDLEGCTPLHLAAGYDLEGKCVEYLLQHKADQFVKDRRGFTAIHYAIAGGNMNAVNYLLNYYSIGGCPSGSSVTIFEHTNEMPDVTPLHLAVSFPEIFFEKNRNFFDNFSIYSHIYFINT